MLLNILYKKTGRWLYSLTVIKKQGGYEVVHFTLEQAPFSFEK